MQIAREIPKSARGQPSPPTFLQCDTSCLCQRQLTMNPPKHQHFHLFLVERSGWSPQSSKLRPVLSFFEPGTHQNSVYNRKSFRYTKAISDPSFPALQYHRQTETASGPSFEPEDTSPHVFFSSPSCTAVTTQKGFRMARATTGAREGRYYWEAKILSGIRADPMDGDPRGHVRIGIARREAQLDGR